MGVSVMPTGNMWRVGNTADSTDVRFAGYWYCQVVMSTRGASEPHLARGQDVSLPGVFSGGCR